MILSLLSTQPAEPADGSLQFAEQVRRGDRSAWDRLVTDEHSRLFNLHLRLTGDREAAADLTQETFATAYQSARGFAGNGSPRAWLYGVALNLGRNWLRKEGKREPADAASDDLPDPQPTAEELALLRERRELVVAAVRKLPEIYRRAVAMRYFAGLTAVEIAQDEGVEPGTVRWRLHQANKQLWALLQPSLGEENDNGSGHGELQIAP
jgi:RNA polymerase sigma-70 factor (ECF subfamily)